MRQFILYNAIGERYNLNDLKSFMQNPEGLGMERKVDYEQIGEYYVPISDELKQKKPEGVICFENYEEYFLFAQFISRRPLVLEYRSAGTYRIDVAVTKLEKTELAAGGLYCKVKMEATSTYYKEVVFENTESKTGKSYPYVYPYTYSDFLSGVIEIDSNTTMESPTRITIWGPCVNPAWAHYVNGVLEARGKVRCELGESRKLVIDTRNTPWSINEYDAGNRFVADRYEHSDFSTQRFILLSSGRNKLVFSHEGIGEMKVRVEAAILYETV